jgi:hypothetical protein
MEIVNSSLLLKYYNAMTDKVKTNLKKIASWRKPEAK